MVMEANLLKEAAARAETQGRSVYLPFPDDVVDEAFPGIEKPIELLAGDEDVGLLPGLAAILKEMTLHNKENRKRHRRSTTSKKQKSLTNR